MISNLNKFSLVIWAVSLLLFAGSCKKDKDANDETPAAVAPKLSAQVDGVAFAASTIELNEDNGIYTLSGFNNADKSITLVFNSTAEGTYILTFDEVSMLYTAGALSWTGGPSANGTITITDNANGKLKGTFQAVLDELLMTGTSVQITSGQFEGIAY